MKKLHVEEIWLNFKKCCRTCSTRDDKPPQRHILHGSLDRWSTPESQRRRQKRWSSREIESGTITRYIIVCRQTHSLFLDQSSWKTDHRVLCPLWRKLILLAKPFWNGRTQKTSIVAIRRYVIFVGLRRRRSYDDDDAVGVSAVTKRYSAMFFSRSLVFSPLSVMHFTGMALHRFPDCFLHFDGLPRLCLCGFRHYESRRPGHGPVPHQVYI